MGWREAIDLVRVLRSDPSSQLVASLEGWDFPLSREGWMLADLLDIEGRKALGNKWKRYLRPVKADADSKTRRGNAAGRTPSQVKEILARFGHAVR